MKKHTPLTDENGEVRELTEQDMARFRPAHEVLPLALQKTLGIRRRGPQKTPTKTATTIRIDTDVIGAFKATGRGWQPRMNNILREAVEQGRI